MKKIASRIFALLLVSLLAGCITLSPGYENEYVPLELSFGTPQQGGLKRLAQGQLPEIRETDNINTAIMTALSQGWLPLGRMDSQWERPGDDAKERMEYQAALVGAPLIVSEFRFLGSDLRTRTNYRNIERRTYDSKGKPRYDVISVPQSSTYRVDVFRHEAWFFGGPSAKPRLGLIVTSVPEDKKSILKRNTGVYVKAAVRDTPAYDANIVGDDIIIEFNKKTVREVSDLVALLEKTPQGKVTLKIVRNGSEKTENTTLTLGEKNAPAATVKEKGNLLLTVL